jgi:hypothetical protein
MQEPIDDKGTGGSDEESSPFTEGASLGKCIGMDRAFYNQAGQPLDQPPGKRGWAPSVVFQEQLAERREWTVEFSERDDGVWHGVESIRTSDQIKAAGWKRQASSGGGTNNGVFEPKPLNPRQAILCQSQHVLTAIDPIQFGVGESLMQQGKQDPCSAGHIQQAWCATVLPCMIGDGLDIKSREGFREGALCKVVEALVIGLGASSSIIGRHGCPFHFFSWERHVTLSRLGIHRVQEKHWLESSSFLLDLCGHKTGFQNHRSRIAVPMAIAHAACREWHERILYPCSYLSLRANMFEHQQGATWLEHSPDLAQTARWITHGTENELHYRTVEMRIGERERLDRSASKSDRNGSILQALPCRDKHRLVRLNRLHAPHAPLLVEGEVLTPIGTDFKHDPVCLPGGLTPQGIEHPPDERLPHHPIVTSGKTWIRDILHPREMTQLIAHRIAPSQ